jgi:hypothetical protein
VVKTWDLHRQFTIQIWVHSLRFIWVYLVFRDRKLRSDNTFKKKYRLVVCLGW